MFKQASFILLATLLVSCGGSGPAGKLPGSTPRSHVSPLFKPIPLNQSHGDGRYAVFTVKMPLSETSIDSVDSPIDPRSGVSRVPIFGDVLRLIGQATLNVATLFGAGAQKIIMSQPLPEIDDEIIKHLSIKRVFFQIEQTKNLEERGRRNLWERFRSLIRGAEKIDFDFIKELKINMRMASSSVETTSWIPDVIFPDDNAERFAEEVQIATADPVRPFTLFNYQKKNRKSLMNNSDLGSIFVIYTEHAVAMQRFIRDQEEFKTVVKDVVKVGKSLIIELKGKEVATQKFFHILDMHETIVAGFEIKKIDECDDDICMDLKIDQTNLLPMLMRGNTLKIDTTMNLAKIPAKSFQLRGYIEFEIKIDSPL